MKIILKVLSYPFTWGLLVGLIFAAWAFSAWWGAKRNALREIKKKDEEIGRQKNTNNTSNEALVEKIEDFKKQLAENQTEITNLRLECAALQQKPDRAELKKLHTYEKAVAMLQEDAPGFAQCWPKALRAAEGDREAHAELKRLFSPAATVLPAAETSSQAHAALPPSS